MRDVRIPASIAKGAKLAVLSGWNRWDTRSIVTYIYISLVYGVMEEDV